MYMNVYILCGATLWSYDLAKRTFETSMSIDVFQEMVSAKNPPSFYLNKLRVYLDPSSSKSSRVSDLTPYTPFP